jgi:hypothetical protein
MHPMSKGSQALGHPCGNLEGANWGSKEGWWSSTNCSCS